MTLFMHKLAACASQYRLAEEDEEDETVPAPKSNTVSTTVTDVSTNQRAVQPVVSKDTPTTAIVTDTCTNQRAAQSAAAEDTPTTATSKNSETADEGRPAKAIQDVG